MSPYVWLTDGGIYAMLVRAVPRPGETGDTGTIWYATSTDGLSFTATDMPVLSPGPGPDDIGGCEDPTVFVKPDGSYLVYYTGVDAAHTQGAMILVAGPTLESLEEKQLMLKAPPGEGNIKEATLVQTAAGD